MDDQTLASLKTALSATPQNRELRMVLIRAHADRDEPDEALELLREIPPSDLADAGQRLLAGQVCLDADEAAEALEYAAGDDPRLLLLQARALLALERRPEGRARYDAAVAASPALEDLDLRAQLGANVREFPEREDRPRLRVISNDDTDDDRGRPPAPPASSEPVTFADVGGLDEIKEQIEPRIILPFQKPSLFRSSRSGSGGGILLYGPPGCGKTLLARATAGECKATFLNVAI